MKLFTSKTKTKTKRKLLTCTSRGYWVSLWCFCTLIQCVLTISTIPYLISPSSIFSSPMLILYFQDILFFFWFKAVSHIQGNLSLSLSGSWMLSFKICFHLFSCIRQNFVLNYGWIILHCIYIANFPYPPFYELDLIPHLSILNERSYVDTSSVYWRYSL